MPSSNPPDWIDRLFFSASETIGTPPDHLKLISTALFSLILGLPFIYLNPTPRPRHPGPSPSPARASNVYHLLPSTLSVSSLLPHLYGIAVSTCYLTLLLKLYSGLFQLVGMTVGTWLLCGVGIRYGDEKGRLSLLGGRGRGGGGMRIRWPWVVFWGLMAHLTVNHFHRMVYEIPDTVVEITGSQMVLVMKLSMFAWNLYDGHLSSPSPSPSSSSSPIKLDSYQSAHSVSSLPPLLSFLSFAFFPAGLLIGPSFTYASYDRFLTKDVFRDSKKHDDGEDEGEVVIPPGRFTTAADRLFWGLVNLGIYSFLGAKADYTHMLREGFRERPWIYKFAYMQLCGITARVKYYGAWKLAESGFIVSGLAYDPSLRTWTASRNIRVRAIEFAQNFKLLLDAWNANTNVWLREAIYKRVARQGRKPGFKSKMATFAASAAWHGPNPAYFFTFLMGGFLSNLGVHLRRNVRPFFLPPGQLTSSSSSSSSSSLKSKSRPHSDGGNTTDVSTAPSSPHLRASDPKSSSGTSASAFTPPSPSPSPLSSPSLPKQIYDLLGILCTQAGLNFIVAPFLLLSIGSTVKVWSALSWYGLWMTFAPWAVFKAGGGRVLKRALERRERKAEKREEEEGQKEKEGDNDWKGLVEKGTKEGRHVDVEDYRRREKLEASRGMNAVDEL